MSQTNLLKVLRNKKRDVPEKSKLEKQRESGIDFSNLSRFLNDPTIRSKIFRFMKKQI